MIKLRHSDDLVLIPVSDETYLGYHSLYGNLKSFDKFVLAIILEPNRFLKNQSNEIQKYLELFTKEDYIIDESRESSTAEPDLQSILGENVVRKSLVIDLQGFKFKGVGSEQFYKTFNQLLDKFLNDNIQYLYLSIINTGFDVKWDYIKRIFEIISEQDQIFVKPIVKLPLETFEEQSFEQGQMLKQHSTIIELEINDEFLKERLRPAIIELVQQYEPELIFSYTGSSLTSLVNDEVLGLLSKYNLPLKFNLQIDPKAPDQNEALLKELVSLYWQCKNQNIDLYGWWTKPYEGIKASNPDWFCPAYDHQVVLTINNRLKYCKSIETDEQLETVTRYLDSNKIDYDQNQSCRGCEIEGFCGYGCLQWQGEEKQAFCDFLKNLTTQMLVAHWQSQNKE